MTYEDLIRNVQYCETEPGVKIGYEEIGTGDKYIFCAQMSFPNTYYVRKFAEHGYHVVLVWDRGAGPSTTEVEDGNKGWYNAWADDVVAVADHLGVKQFIYTGASHGSGTGWHLLKRHSERVTAFIALVCGPHNIEESKSSFRDMMKGKPAPVFEYEDPSAQKRSDYSRMQFGILREHQTKANYGRPLAELGTEENVREFLKTIKTPTLMFGGRNDMIARPDLMYRTADCLQNCKLIMYSFMSHSDPSGVYTEEVITESLHFLDCLENNEGRMYQRIVE